MSTTNPFADRQLNITRRHFFGRASLGIGTAALASLLNREIGYAYGRPTGAETIGQSAGSSAEFPNFAPSAKRVIYLFQSGAPSQMDLFDFKPALGDLRSSE